MMLMSIADIHAKPSRPIPGTPRISNFEAIYLLHVFFTVVINRSLLVFRRRLLLR
jgi:hypothetical protein